MVARVGGVAVAAAAVVRGGRVGDEVPARQQPAGQLGVRPHAAVDDGHRQAGRAGGHVPGRRRVDAGGGLEQVPLLAVHHVVRPPVRLQEDVGLGVEHVGVLRQAAGDGPRLGQRHPAAQARHVGLAGHAAQRGQPLAQHAAQPLQPRRAAGGIGVAQAHDEAVDRGRLGSGLCRAAGGVFTAAGQHGQDGKGEAGANDGAPVQRAHGELPCAAVRTAVAFTGGWRRHPGDRTRRGC
ncbi:hypothetical protein [Aquabacterium sp. J223]|uniref:hypothetical protein n=1 Tax=Aquabacterium sp. J223 TaxID=2898431 RepID=UPI0021AD7B7A|nr:hypothetical protein [Aquabacterium sp. J223]UUX97968.1 hypothetical protein LRS07_08130 [Aquabacterium sp. J223]